MKRSLFLILALCFVYSANAQKNVNAVKEKAFKGDEPVLNQTPAKYTPPPTMKDITVIGNTIYDLQSNAASDKRLRMQPNGSMVGVFTRGIETGFPDRGTGYNYHNGTTWGSPATARLEGIRTGWPSPAHTATKSVIIAHTGAGVALTNNSAFGATDWTTTALTLNGGACVITWPRIAYGGPDGNTIHLIGHADALNGTSEPLVYVRSLDGGTTWDNAIMLPGFDGTKYGIIGGDGYAVDARGNTVAVASFDNYGDIAVAKSTDNGATWTKYVIIDFPDAAEPFNAANPFDFDNDGNEDTLVSADDAGDVIIDNNGKVHVAFGVMVNMPVSGLYRPYTDGLVYWNEDMGQHTFNPASVVGSWINLPEYLDIVADADINGNDSLDFVEAGDLPFGITYHSLNTYPVLSVNSDNDVVVIYSQVMEGADYAKMDATPNPQHARHIWYRIKRAVSQTWEDAVCITNESGFETHEFIFPACIRDAVETDDQNTIHLIYQYDEEPGMHIRGDEDAGGTNYIIHDYFTFPDDIGITEANKRGTANFTAVPNPVKNQLSVTSQEGAQISVYNIVGSLVINIEKANAVQTIDMTNLTEGTYILRVRTTEGVSAQKNC